MRWFPRRRKRDDEVIYETYTASALQRWQLYDSGIGKPELIAQLIGLPPVSEEVAEMEVAESGKRRAAIASIAPLLTQQASFMATAVAVATVAATDDDSIDEEDLRHLFQAYRWVATGALMSSYAQLIDLGLLELKVTETLEEM